MILVYGAPKDCETKNAPMTPEKPLGILTVTSFIFYSQWTYTLFWHYSPCTGHALFFPFCLKKVNPSSTDTFSVLHYQMHISSTLFEDIKNIHRSDYHLQFWAVTRISKMCSAINTSSRHVSGYYTRWGQNKEE